MAIPKIKATYSLDPETLRVLERAAQRWGVSKSEALRRAIRTAAALDSQDDTPAGALDQLQNLAGLSASKATAWAADVRAERHSSRGGSKGK